MSEKKMPFGEIHRFLECPEQYPASCFFDPAVTQVFYESVPYRGKPTRVFACYGLPEHASPDHPVPGIVLIHGGGASALADWDGGRACMMSICRPRTSGRTMRWRP